MPEMTFHIRWPDGRVDACYSPSLVIKDYFQPGSTYALADFVGRSRTALTIASDRVRAKYGMACGHALAQIATIEETARSFAAQPDAHVAVLTFEE